MPVLTIDIEARLAKFQDGLDSIARSAGRTAQQIDRSFSAVRSTVIGLGTALIGGSILVALKNTVDELAALDDAAAQSGISVENLSSLLNTLAPTGAGLSDITGLTDKLTQAMRQADTATSDQAKAFKALGVSTKDSNGNLRNVAQVLDDVVIGFDKYADGANKSALMQDLLGKTGTQYAPVLKDLATFTRQGASATTEQAAAAADLQDAIGSITTAVRILKQELVAGLAPALSDFAQRYIALARLGRGPIDMAAGLFNDPQETIDGLERRMADLRRIREEMAKTGDPSIFQRAFNPALRTRESVDEELIGLAGELEKARQIKREMDKLFGKPDAGTKPQAPAVPRGSGPGPSKNAAGSVEDFTDRVNAAIARLIDNTNTVKLRELTAVLQGLDEAAAVGLDPNVYGDALKDVFAGMVASGKDATDVLALLDERFFSGKISVEAYDAAMKEVMRTTLSVGRDGSQELDSLAQKWLDLIDPVRKYALELKEVERLREFGKLTPDQAERAKANIQQRATDELMPGLKDQSEALKDAAEELGMTFTSAFEDAIVEGRNLSEVLKGLEQDIMRIVTRKLVTEPLANGLTNIIGSFMGSMGGGAPISASVPTFVRSEHGNVMTEFGPLKLRKYSAGGVARSPQLSMFGEGSTPEAYVPLPDGRTIPVTMQGGGGDVNITVLANDVESFRRSEGQIKARVAGWSAGAGRYR